MNTLTGYLRQFNTAVRFLLLATVVLGGLYPAVVFGLGQALAPAQANGSLLRNADGSPAASALIAQAAADGDGIQDPRWFHLRPSAAQWDPAASAASNLGPNDPELERSIEERRAAVASSEGIAPSAVPADALTAGGSGLDPDISVPYAELQIPRVAREQRLDEETVRTLVRKNTTTGPEAFLGQPSVRVTTLNLDIATAER